MTQEALWLERDWQQKIVEFLTQHSDQVGYVYQDSERCAWDMSRVDVLTERLAIEIDRSHKWAEAVGQAIFYSTQHRREPAVVLLCGNFSDYTQHIRRSEIVCQKLGIHLWLVDVNKSELYIYGDRFALKNSESVAVFEPRLKIKGL